jgi:hypothetical protein
MTVTAGTADPPGLGITPILGTPQPPHTLKTDSSATRGYAAAAAPSCWHGADVVAACTQTHGRPHTAGPLADSNAALPA